MESKLPTREVKNLFIEMLQKIEIKTINELEEKCCDIEFRGSMTFLYFLRITEIFQGITTLARVGNIASAAILLRSLSEAYIKLKGSIEKPEFNIKDFGSSIENRYKHLKKRRDIHIEKNIPLEPEWEALFAEVERMKKDFDNGLDSAASMFMDMEEHIFYRDIFMPYSDWVHSNRQTFFEYTHQDESIKSIDERDHTSTYVHGLLGTAQVMLESYNIFVDTIPNYVNNSKEIGTLLDSYTLRIMTLIGPRTKS